MVRSPLVAVAASAGAVAGFGATEAVVGVMAQSRPGRLQDSWRCLYRQHWKKQHGSENIMLTNINACGSPPKAKD